MKFKLSPYTDEDLLLIYHDFNVEYFNGSLPNIKVAYSWKYLEKDCEAWLEIDHPPQIYLHLRPDLATCYTASESGILHEQAHLACWMRDKRSRGHGKLWRAEIQRLWDLGAFWDKI